MKKSVNKKREDRRLQWSKLVALIVTNNVHRVKEVREETDSFINFESKPK